jgi:hypothetical protein
LKLNLSKTCLEIAQKHERHWTSDLSLENRKYFADPFKKSDFPWASLSTFVKENNKREQM